MTVADSDDVLIDFLRGGGEAKRVALELETGRLATTAVTAFELWAGAKAPRKHAAASSLLEVVQVLPLTARSAQTAAVVRQQLEGDRQAIGMADSLIAGICLEHRATLLTRNREHFERVANLRLSGRYE